MKLWEVLYEGSNDEHVWTGLLQDAEREAGLSRAQRDKAIKFLKKTECIDSVRVGNRYGATELILNRPPTAEDLSEFLLTNRRPTGKLERRVIRLEERIGGANIVEAIAALDARITKIENINNEGDS
jgi:hypothetical protein